MSGRKWVYKFGAWREGAGVGRNEPAILRPHTHRPTRSGPAGGGSSEGNKSMKHLLGGKGANLGEMACACGHATAKVGIRRSRAPSGSPRPARAAGVYD